MAEWTLDDVVRILDEVASLAGTAHREVQRHALQPGVVPRLLGRAPQVGGAHAVAQLVKRTVDYQVRRQVERELDLELER